MKCKVIGTTNGYFPIGTIVDVEIRTTHVLITGIIDCIKISKQLGKAFLTSLKEIENE